MTEKEEKYWPRLFIRPLTGQTFFQPSTRAGSRMEDKALMLPFAEGLPYWTWDQMCTSMNLSPGKNSTRHVSPMPFYWESEKCKYLSLSRVQLFVIPLTVACQAPPPMEFSRQEFWNCCHFLFQRIFLTQGSNPDLPHHRQIFCVCVWATMGVHYISMIQ